MSYVGCGCPGLGALQPWEQALEDQRPVCQERLVRGTYETIEEFDAANDIARRVGFARGLTYRIGPWLSQVVEAASNVVGLYESAARGLIPPLPGPMPDLDGYRRLIADGSVAGQDQERALQAIEAGCAANDRAAVEAALATYYGLSDTWLPRIEAATRELAQILGSAPPPGVPTPAPGEAVPGAAPAPAGTPTPTSPSPVSAAPSLPSPPPADASPLVWREWLAQYGEVGGRYQVAGVVIEVVARGDARIILSSDERPDGVPPVAPPPAMTPSGGPRGSGAEGPREEGPVAPSSASLWIVGAAIAGALILGRKRRSHVRRG
jgi:hypothetical protein